MSTSTLGASRRKKKNYFKIPPYRNKISLLFHANITVVVWRVNFNQLQNLLTEQISISMLWVIDICQEKLFNRPNGSSASFTLDNIYSNKITNYMSLHRFLFTCCSEWSKSTFPDWWFCRRIAYHWLPFRFIF